MIKNNFGESIVGIIIGVFIIAFIILGVTNLIINSKGIINEYENEKVINILTNNTQNIIKKLDLTNIGEGETFYIYKNNSIKEFEIFTGAANTNYKNIDEYGNHIDDLNTFEGKAYSMSLVSERNNSEIGDIQQKILINIDPIINY